MSREGIGFQRQWVIKMRIREDRVFVFFVVLMLSAGCVDKDTGAVDSTTVSLALGGRVELPEPRYDGNTSVEKAILNRRSRRSYGDRSLTTREVSQLLWAAQGITDWGGGKRAAPSAGATYPLELYLVAGNVEGLPQGVYHYIPDEHCLILHLSGDCREKLVDAAFDQSFIGDAPASVVFTVVYDRTTSGFGPVGERYVHLETGHSAENLCLQAEGLGLATVTVGAFDEYRVIDVLELEDDEFPLYILPVGEKEAGS